MVLFYIYVLKIPDSSRGATRNPSLKITQYSHPHDEVTVGRQHKHRRASRAAFFFRTGRSFLVSEDWNPFLTSNLASRPLVYFPFFWPLRNLRAARDSFRSFPAAPAAFCRDSRPRRPTCTDKPSSHFDGTELELKGPKVVRSPDSPLSHSCSARIKAGLPKAQTAVFILRPGFSPSLIGHPSDYRRRSSRLQQLGKSQPPPLSLSPWFSLFLVSRVDVQDAKSPVEDKSIELTIEFLPKRFCGL